MNRQAWDRLLPLLIIVVAAAHIVQPDQANVHYRLQPMLKAGHQMALGAGVDHVLSHDCRAYDAGTPLLLGLTLRLSYSYEELARGCPSQPPKLYYLLMFGANAVCFIILYLALRDLLDRAIAFGLTAVYLLSPAARFVFFAADEYFFPIYAGTLMLAGVALLGRRHRWVPIVLGLCAAGIAGCNLFRRGAVVVVAGFLLVLVAPRLLAMHTEPRIIRRRAAACLAGVMLLTAAATGLVGGAHHMFWHALHCGLAEFGGYEDSRGEIYPYFVPRDALPPDARPVDCWSDQREVRFVQSVDPAIREWTPEYERVMRDDFFRIVRQNPAGTAGLIGRRLWRLMALNPWARHTADSELLPCWTDDLARAIWAVLCVGGLICGLPRRTLLVACGLLPLALPPLLVHSGYIMYNLAGQFPLYLLGIAGARAIQLRFSGRRQTRLAENDPR